MIVLISIKGCFVMQFLSFFLNRFWLLFRASNITPSSKALQYTCCLKFAENTVLCCGLLQSHPHSTGFRRWTYRSELTTKHTHANSHTQHAPLIYRFSLLLLFAFAQIHHAFCHRRIITHCPVPSIHLTCSAISLAKYSFASLHELSPPS